MTLARPALLAACLFVAGTADAQSNLDPGADPAGPRAALERLVMLNSASALNGLEGQALLAGELDDGIGASLGPLTGPDVIVMLAGDRAVARMHYRERRDAYLYLHRAGGAWTIDAIRTLALPPFVVTLGDSLRATPRRTAEQDEMLANLELTMRSDAELLAWFGAHRSELEQLRALAEAGRGASAQAETILHELHLLSAGAEAGLVRVTIGGILDNGVGFLHADRPEAVPPIDPIEHIWIEPVGGGWYLFKTT